MATLGGGGLFVLAFLDSSVLSFPLMTDLIVLEQSILHPARMPYYTAMATLGSLAGCVWLYLIAKKGGEAYFHSKAGRHGARIRAWVERNAFLSVAVPAILPPPMPFKVFVLASGVFQVPLRTFVLALLVGRGVRYFAEGLLAVRYGEAATRFLIEKKDQFAGIVLALMLVSYLLSRWLFCRPDPQA